MPDKRQIRIEKVVLSAGATGDKLNKSARLLELISKMKAVKTKSKKRIPSLGVKPGLELGCYVTIRNKTKDETLKKLLAAINNQLDSKQINNNHFSFGIKEYIEIPGMEYNREIGILGLNVTVVFSRPGSRVNKRKIKRSKLPKKQIIKKEEIIEFIKKNFNTKVK